MMRRFRLWMLGGLAAVILSMMGASGAHAASWQDKVNYEGVITCYHNGLDAGGLVDSITLNYFDGTINVLANRVGDKIVSQVGGPHLSEWSGWNDAAVISCYDLLTSKTALKIPTSASMNSATRKSVLESIKYYAAQSGVSGAVNSVNSFLGNESYCYAFPYAERNMNTGEDSTAMYSGSLCASDNSVSVQGADRNGIITLQASSGDSVKVTIKTGTIIGSGIGGSKTECAFTLSSGEAECGGKSYTGFKNNPVELIASVGNFIADTMKAVPTASDVLTKVAEEGGANVQYKIYSACEKYSVNYNSFREVEDGNASLTCSGGAFTGTVNTALMTDIDLDTAYHKPVVRFMDGANSSTDPAEPNNALVNAFSKGAYENYNAIRFTDEEAYQLYDYYLSDVYGRTDLYCSDEGNLTSAGEYSARMWWSEQGKFATCYFDVDSENIQKNKVYGLYRAGDGVHGVGHFGRLMEFSEVLDALNALTSLETNPGDGITNDVENSDINSVGQLCQSTDVVGVKWALCPALENMTYTVSAIDKTVEDWLTVDTDMYGIRDSDGNITAAYRVWEIMRNIANALMVIFLLAVIFSQLTGRGIDNYGIKKILPRLIVMAILINLSFYICELAVDLSNILGVGLRDLFYRVGALVGSRNSASFSAGMEDFVGNIVAAVFEVVGVAGAASAIIVAAVAVPGGGPMAVVLLILAIAAVLFAVLLFFVMLGARLILVIGCMAVAPIAFACYILPNTQSIFKKWADLFKAVLIIFPICGAIGGISYLIKAMVLTMEGVHLWMLVAALVAPYLPFFLLPTLLKSALALMGKVGAGITGMGNAFRSGMQRGESTASNALRNTDSYREGVRNRTLRRAERNIGRLERRRGQQNGRLSAADTRRLAVATSTRDKLNREDYAANAIVAEQDYRDATLDTLNHDWTEAFNDGNEDRLRALTSVMINRYGTTAANRIGTNLESADLNGNNGTNHRRSMAVLRDEMNHNSTFAGHMKNKAPDAYQMIGDGGITATNDDGTVVYGNLDHFTANNGVSTELKDWASAGSGALRRAMNSGKLSTETVQQLLESDDPSIRSGIQSDPGKRDLLQAHMYNQLHQQPQGMQGPDLPAKIAAQRYRDEMADNARATQEDAAARARHEEDAVRIGKSTMSYVDRDSGIASDFDGYATPAGFDSGATHTVRNGQHIYTDRNNGREWNASTGRYEKY